VKVHPVVDAMRRERHKRGWTQADLAKHSGVAETTIAGWESGAYSPQLALLTRVLDVLDLRLDAFPYHATKE
jgi:transcriptional regulator with XRE-family HTH domain